MFRLDHLYSCLFTLRLLIRVYYHPPSPLACGIIGLGGVELPKSRAQMTYFQNIPE